MHEAGPAVILGRQRVCAFAIAIAPCCILVSPYIYIYSSSILDPGYGISYSLPDQHSASDPAEPAVPPVASTGFFSCSRFAPRLTKNRRHIHTGVATLEGEKETRASNFVASCPLQSHPSSRRRRRHGWPILPDPWRHHPLST